MPTVISLDIGNTLIDLKASKGFCSYFCERVGMEISEIRDLLNDYFLCSNLPIDVAVKKVCKLIGNNSYSEIIDNYEQNNKIAVFKDVLPVLKILQKKGIIIIAFSNCTPWEATGLKEYGLTQYISKVYYSYDIGFTKPKIKAFDYVRSDMKIPANEILHIGDTFDADALGALNAGWGACWLNRNKKLIPSNYNRKITIISSLWELMDILKIK